MKKGQPARQDGLFTLKLHLCLKFKPGHFHLSFKKQHATKIQKVSYYYKYETVKKKLLSFSSKNQPLVGGRNTQNSWTNSTIILSPGYPDLVFDKFMYKKDSSLLYTNWL